VRWTRVGMLVLVTALTGSRGEAAPEDTPDAQMLLDLDILTQPEARDRDFMRRMSLFERLRMIELFRMLDETPTAAARRPPGTPAAPPGVSPPPPPPSGAPPAPPAPATGTPPTPASPAVKDR
jgi:hypothetical protein